jgi:hypothetical protein
MPKALEVWPDSFYTQPDRRGEFPRLVCWAYALLARLDALERVYSSVVEHFVDIEGVTSSNLVTPTIHRLRFGRHVISLAHRSAAKKEKGHESP